MFSRLRVFPNVLAEPFGLGEDSPYGRVRYVFWLVVAVLVFVFSRGQVTTPLEKIAEEFFRFDSAIRGAAQAAFDLHDLIPITLVEIDDETTKVWRMADVTPKKELTRLLDVVSQAEPAAVVLDIDLSDSSRVGASSTDPEPELFRFLESYRRRAPLILVRRVNARADGSLRLVPNAFVKAIDINSNARVSWAHALYVTDDDGTVRRWQETVRACADTGDFESLPAVAIAVLTQAQWTVRVFPRPEYTPDAGASCRSTDSTAITHVAMFGRRLTGGAASYSGRSIGRLSAWQVTDGTVLRDDDALFRGRVVIVGGTHERAGDVWRTPVGMMPGIELVANTIRFSAGQVPRGGARVRWLDALIEQLWAVAFFLGYAALGYKLRAGLAVLSGIGMTLVAMYITIGYFGFFSALDAIESALLLYVQFRFAEETFTFVHDLRTKHSQALWSARFSEEPHHGSREKR